MFFTVNRLRAFHFLHSIGTAPHESGETAAEIPELKKMKAD
jgi:hypothetical protein